MSKDEVFKKPIQQSSDFKFDTKVVKVFDDMVTRSVPFYIEMQRMISELAGEYAMSGSSIYDLGCSTGTTMVNMNETVAKDVKFIGIDDSSEMLDQCRDNLVKSGVEREFDLRSANLNKGVDIKNASVVVLCLTLQFIRPLHRVKLLQEIHKGLNEGGCLILVEKVGEIQEMM